MLLTHQTVHTLDADDADVFSNRSILSVIWWEEAGIAQARYASFFLDEAIDASQATVYDLPELVNDAGPTTLGGPSPRRLRLPVAAVGRAPAGDLLASFADALLATSSTSSASPTRPISASPRATTSRGSAGASRSSASPAEGPIAMTPTIGHGLRSDRHRLELQAHPLLAGRTSALRYIRFDGSAWSDVRSIALSDDMTTTARSRSFEGMASRN